MTITTPDVVIIVLTLDQCAKTVRCLKSLSRLQYERVQILLWDNGSSDDTVAAVSSALPDVHVHYSPENLGVAGGRNAAARLAIDRFAPEFLFFIDNDMTAKPDALGKLVAPFQHDSWLAQATGKILDMADSGRIYGAGGCQIRFWLGDTNHVGYGERDVGQYDETRRCICSGGCMLVKTSVFERFHGFDECFNPYGPEDLDFGLRIREEGLYGQYIPDAVVYHESHPGRTFGGGSYSQQYAANRARQWLNFLARHGKWYQKMAFYGLGGPFLLAKLMIREAKRNNLGPALRGIGRGILGQ